MKVSLIIAYYKNLQFLDLILQSLEVQTQKNFEVIIAEDDDSQETIFFLNSARKQYSFVIEHLSQENNGFRKNKILNKSIIKAKADYIIFIDGDCVLHNKFIKQHLENKQKNLVLIGRRLMLSKKLTQNAILINNYKSFSFKNFVLTNCKKIECGIYFPILNSNRKSGVWGCNWSVFKDKLIEINGFDEDYTKAGVGEDVDIEWRLRATGLEFKSVKFKAIQYHLHHSSNYSTEDVEHNFRVLKQKKILNRIKCLNGLIKIDV